MVLKFTADNDALMSLSFQFQSPFRSLSLFSSASSPSVQALWFGVVCENLCAFLLCVAVVSAFGAFVLRIPVYSGIRSLLAYFVVAKSKANS